MSLFSAAIQRGTRAGQPGAATVIVGTLYCVTDENDKIERSNGATWDAYSPVLSDANLSTTDITTNNVSIAKHGFAPKAPNDATKYLDGTGAYSVPAGGGGGGTSTQFIVLDGEPAEEVMPLPGPAGANGTNGASAQILIATLDLTNSNFDNGNSTPLDVVAAPGVNKVIVPISATLYCNVTVSKAANPTQRLRWNGDTGPVGEHLQSINLPLNTTGEAWRMQACDIALSATNISFANSSFDPRNKSLQWSMSVNTASGTGTGKIRVVYYIADFS